MAQPDWNVLEFFKEEIQKDNDAQIRVNAVKNLHLIASAMGQVKVVEELIPFLNKEIGLGGSKDKEASVNSNANDDEFLFGMATQYAMLKEYIKEDSIVELIDPLVHLATMEETVIRDEAIKSICKICEEKPQLVRDKVYKHLLDMVGKSEFTTRVSACALFGTVYKIHSKEAAMKVGGAAQDEFPKVRANLCKTYQEICKDDTPMVRRASANRLQDFVKELELEDLIGEDFLQAYKALAGETTQDAIPMNIVSTTIEMARKIKTGEYPGEGPSKGTQFNRDHTVDVIRGAVENRSWRVRLAVAKNMDKLMLNFGYEISNEVLMKEGLQRLLKDQEQEVRKEAVKIIEACLKIKWDDPASMTSYGNNGQPEFKNLRHWEGQEEGDEAVLKGIVQHIAQNYDATVEQGQPVRAAISAAIGPVAQAVGRESTQKDLMKCVLALMKDEFHDVRLNVVSHAGTLCGVLGETTYASQCLTTFTSLMMDNHWRIRRCVVEQIPRLNFDTDKYIKNLEGPFLSSLKDSVYSVRAEALKQLKLISKLYGPQWTGDHLLPKILEIYSGGPAANAANDSGYCKRVTTLQALPYLWENLLEQEVQKKVMQLIDKALKDSVANVRFCACKTVIDLLKMKNRDEVLKLKSTLKDLENDTDSDVQYFAQQAIREMG